MYCAAFRGSPYRPEDSLQHLIGIGFKIAATFLLTSMAALVKLMADTIPTGELMFARSFFALGPLIVWMIIRKEFPTALRTNRLGGQILRGAFGGAAMIGFFTALRFLPLPDMTAIQFVSPLMTVALAALLLGETVRLFRWTAVSVGFLGVILILWPHIGGGWKGDEGAFGALLAVVAASLTALAMIQIRNLAGSETTASIVFYFSITTSVMGLATLPFGWVMPDLKGALILLAIGLIGGFGQILLTLSYRYAPASVIAPFDYTAMIWSILLGFLMFGEVPLPIVLVGSTVVIAAGLAVIWREHWLGLKRAEMRRSGLPPV
ncbi:DMT family transporter [Microbaculum marinum]|uniref:DMT family transporter n=1 Tax=Microbaculum marinum TaxID=1764581 RepID=A0AAW9RRB0_9HYPH